jgi:hydroxyacylglutathione hydrolase
MLWQRIESEGIDHYSYLVGEAGEALVIDPRRDTDVYESWLSGSGYRLRYILETHRNEDCLSGSVGLADRTGAEIWHADRQLDYAYGEAAQDRQEWPLGNLRLRALATPGHTPGHLSYVLHDWDGSPWILFSGDTLFAGGVGRTDLLGREAVERLTQELYESLYRHLLSLGDGVILCPAHGPGSVCGSSLIADRPLTTIGFERQHNPWLQLDQETFARRAGMMGDLPPYFKEMERRNLEGAPLRRGLPLLEPLSPDQFEAKRHEVQLLDVREVEAFGGAHVPKSLSVYQGEIPWFGGWFLSYDRTLLLVLADDAPETLVRSLVRMGYDRIGGYLAGGLHAWYSHGMPTTQIRCFAGEEARRRAESGEDWLLDVRSPQELETHGKLPGATNIPIRRVLDRLDDIPRDRSLLVSCSTGRRSMIVASLLRQRGWDRLGVVLGGLTD